MKKSTMKRLGLVATAALMTLGLVACSTANGESSSSIRAQSNADGRTVLKVQMIGGFSNNDTMDAITGEIRQGLYVLEEEFESLYPEIDLQYLTMGWDDYQKKTQSMIMGNEADVYQAPGIAALSSQGLLEPLEEYISRDNYDLSVYLDGQMDGWLAMSPDDEELEIYGLPMIADTRFMMYDKQIFDDFGVPYLSDSPTLEEVFEAGKAMTGINPVTGEMNYGFYYDGKDAGDTLMNFNEYYGGTWGTGFHSNEIAVEFDSDTMIQAAEIFKEINSMSPTGSMASQGGEAFGTTNNNIAIHLRCQPFDLNNINNMGLGDRYAVTRLFINEEEGMGGMFAGSPVVMSVNSAVKDESWEYMKFTSSDFFTEYMWEHQRLEGLPVTNSIFQFEEVENDENIVKMMESIEYLWTPRYAYRAGQGRSSLTAAIEDIILNGANVEDRLSSGKKEVDDWVKIQ